MAKQRFALEYGEEKRLTITWKGWYKNLTVAFDDVVLATYQGQDELISGQNVPLPDGSQLEIILKKSWLSTNLQLSRNGKPIPGTSSDINSKLTMAYSVMYVIAAFSILSGLAAFVFNEPTDIYLGMIPLGIGIIFFYLGQAARNLSITAIIIGLVIYGIDTIFVFFSGKTYGLFTHFIFLYAMYQGIPTIKAIQAEKEALNPISPSITE